MFRKGARLCDGGATGSSSAALPIALPHARRRMPEHHAGREGVQGAVRAAAVVLPLRHLAGVGAQVLARDMVVLALLAPAAAGRLINQLREVAVMMQPLPAVTACSDPHDNYLLAIAQAGRADFPVTGDKRRPFGALQPRRRAHSYGTRFPDDAPEAAGVTDETIGPFFAPGADGQPRPWPDHQRPLRLDARPAPTPPESLAHPRAKPARRLFSGFNSYNVPFFRRGGPMRAGQPPTRYLTPSGTSQEPQPTPAPRPTHLSESGNPRLRGAPPPAAGQDALGAPGPFVRKRLSPFRGPPRVADAAATARSRAMATVCPKRAAHGTQPASRPRVPPPGTAARRQLRVAVSAVP